MSNLSRKFPNGPPTARIIFLAPPIFPDLAAGSHRDLESQCSGSPSRACPVVAIFRHGFNMEQATNSVIFAAKS
jgi:hypothetical protein